MSIIYVLVPIAILLTAIGLYLFFWAVKAEQFEDIEKQGLSILFEDDQPEQKATDTTQSPSPKLANESNQINAQSTRKNSNLS